MNNMPRSYQVFSFALPLPIYHSFDYKVDQDIDAQPGQRFVLPFANGKKLGLLVSAVDNSRYDLNRLKNIETQLDSAPLLSKHLMQLARWLADYYCQPLGEVTFLFMPRYCRKLRSMKTTRVQIWSALECEQATLDSLQQKAPRQFQLMLALKQNPDGLNAAALKAVQANWHAQIKVLQKKGLVIAQHKENLPPIPEVMQTGPVLTRQQQKICETIAPTLHDFHVHLIQGVTGSGKTEVYVQLMQQVLAQGRQVIYLVPEIGLTPQLIKRIQQRLTYTVVSSHSAQTDFKRYQSWDQFRRGVAQVLIGTRSALFSDASGLGLMIIDEEHDASYRQQDGVRYHARDVAIKRAQMLGIPVIMGSATPSLESLQNLNKPHYHFHELRQRPNQSAPPKIELLDIANTPLTGGCSPRLLQAIDKHLSLQGQVLLFLNRRGYAPVVMCHDCGWQASCYQCDARMTLHQSVNKLICHHCGYSMQLPQQCPDCGEPNIKHYGIGTQQLEQFLQQRFSEYKTIRIDRDSVQGAEGIEHRLEPVQRGEPCILVGTQMLAKGHDYPHITLVGILDADQALFSSFYRAAERLVQTVLQVSGRAGRAGKTGQALLQTRFVNHPLMQNLCVQSYTDLARDMLQERKLLGFPPFARVVTLLVDALQLDDALQRLQLLVKPIQASSVFASVKMVGPIPALMTRRVGRYRAQLSVMSDQIRPIRILLQELMPFIIKQKNTQKSRLVIEVDPLDL